MREAMSAPSPITVTTQEREDPWGRGVIGRVRAADFVREACAAARAVEWVVAFRHVQGRR